MIIIFRNEFFFFSDFNHITGIMAVWGVPAVQI